MPSSLGPMPGTGSIPSGMRPVGATDSRGFEFFRYDGLWAPGVRLFRSIGFSAKAAVHGQSAPELAAVQAAMQTEFSKPAGLQAVQAMDVATQQNAALVEQTAAVAGSLNDHALGLAQEVAQFRLPAA